MTLDFDRPNTKYYVYEHYRKDSGVVFYVGKGQKDRAIEFNRRSTYWKRIKEKHGIVVKIVFCTDDESLAYQEEIRLISKYKEDGIDLANMTIGGDGFRGLHHTEESKEKLRRTHAKPDVKEKHRISTSMGTKKAFENNQEAREKISKKSKERFSTQESRDTMSEKIKITHSNIKIKKKIGDAAKINWGKKYFRDLVVSSIKKRWANPIYKEKLIAILKISNNKPEVKEKLRLASKERWENPEYKERLRESQKIAQRISCAKPEIRAIRKAAIRKSRSKKFICIENGMEFITHQDAEDWLKQIGKTKARASSNVGNALKGKLPTAYGFHWRYV